MPCPIKKPLIKGAFIMKPGIEAVQHYSFYKGVSSVTQVKMGIIKALAFLG